MSYSHTMKFLQITFFVSLLWASCLSQPKKKTKQCPSNALATSLNSFGSKLSKAIAGTDNLFVSPLSIYLTLSLLYLGSGGNTAEQLESALGLEKLKLKGQRLHRAVQQLMRTMDGRSEEYSLLLSNGLFLKKNLPVNGKFLENSRTYYNASVQKVDFTKRGETTRRINGWARDRTKGAIPKFLKQPMDSATVMAGLNAVYFKGFWETAFDKEHNTRRPFYLRNGNTRNVEFMIHSDKEFRYFDDSQTRYKFLEIPYKGDDVSMLIALPKSKNGQTNLGMNSRLLCRINKSMESQELSTVALPKFKVEYRNDDLVEVLKSLGITDVFGSSANLARISSQNLVVSKFQHVAVVDVNEEGTEAAALSAIGMADRMLWSEILPEFIVDRPFLFYIIDKRNDVVLFSGRIVDPKY